MILFVLVNLVLVMGRMHSLCQGFHTRAFGGDVIGEVFGGGKSLLAMVR